MSDSSSSLQKVLTALALLREATPAEIAAQAGLGYSTVPPKLRRLQADDLATPSPDSGTGKSVRTWTLTPKGILAAAVTPDTAVPDTEQMPAEQNTAGENDGNTVSLPHTDDADDHHEATEPHLPVDLTSTIDAPVASDEGAPSDGQGSDIDTEPASMPAPAGPEPDPSPRPADTGPQPGLASPGLVTPAATGPDRRGTNIAVSTSEQRPEDADTEPAQTDPAEPGEPTEQNIAGPQSPEPAAQPASALHQGAGAGVAGKDDKPGEAQNDEPADVGQGTKPRRRSGSLREAALKVLQNNPDQKFTVSQVRKAVDAANTDSDAAKASAGAVNNALLKLTNDGVIQRVVETPAAYQAV